MTQITHVLTENKDNSIEVKWIKDGKVVAITRLTPHFQSTAFYCDVLTTRQ